MSTQKDPLVTYTRNKFAKPKGPACREQYEAVQAERDRLQAQRDALLAAAKAALPILAREHPFGGSETYRQVQAAIAAVESNQQVTP